MGVDALMRGCVDAMQESPAATIPVLFSAPLKGEPRIVVALRAFFMPAEPASELASDYNRIRREATPVKAVSRLP